VEPLYKEKEPLTNLEYIDRCGGHLYKNTQRLNILECLTLAKTQEMKKLKTPIYKTIRFNGNPSREFPCYSRENFKDPLCSYKGELFNLGNMIKKYDCNADNIISLIMEFINSSIYKNLPFKIIITIDKEIIFDAIMQYLNLVGANLRSVAPNYDDLTIIEINENNIIIYVHVKEQNKYERRMILNDNNIKVLVGLSPGQKILFVVNKEIDDNYSNSLDPPYYYDSFKIIEETLLAKQDKDTDEYRSFFDIIGTNPDTYNIFISSYLARHILFTSMIAYNLYKIMDTYDYVQEQRTFAILYNSINQVYNFNFIYDLHINYFFYFALNVLRKTITVDLFSQYAKIYNDLCSLKSVIDVINMNDGLYYRVDDILIEKMNNILRLHSQGQYPDKKSIYETILKIKEQEPKKLRGGGIKTRKIRKYISSHKNKFYKMSVNKMDFKNSKNKINKNTVKKM
jgi:hypothetical protein